MIRKYACLDENNIVIKIEDLNIDRESVEGAVSYIGLSDRAIIPQVGQIFNFETNEFETI